jgi:hypothetical protein
VREQQPGRAGADDSDLRAHARGARFRLLELNAGGANHAAPAL